MLPREQGIEGWLWTSTGGSALTLIGEGAPTGALLFTKPLGPDQLKEAMEPSALEALAAHSPLGVPSVLGILFRVAEPANAESAFRQYGLLRPLTDREVPPTMRRSLPTDRPADPTIGGTSAPSTSRRAPRLLVWTLDGPRSRHLHALPRERRADLRPRRRAASRALPVV